MKCHYLEFSFANCFSSSSSISFDWKSANSSKSLSVVI
nr:MAG TPA: hypothetical protein [Caudoviricetes sp.]